MKYNNSIKPYEDHIGLWEKELKQWVPDNIFDAHVHLGTPEVMGYVNSKRLKQPPLTFTSFTWEQAKAFYKQLYSGKTVAGVIAFPFPLLEVNLEAANQYIIELMKIDPTIKGFLLSDPRNTDRTIANFNMAIKSGVRFSGVKPYYDLLGKSNFETTMDEFIPKDLLGFMNSENLIMMLHTSGIGMADNENQLFIKCMAENFPKIKIILAHMGRYTEIGQFYKLMNSDVLSYENIFLEMSSASEKEVYREVLSRKKLHDRLLFGSDLPYGLITGVEHWSEEKGAVFITRDDYPWSDSNLNKQFYEMRTNLTYNTYHTIKSLKDALDSLNLDIVKAEQLKKKIFFKNLMSELFKG